MLFEVKADITMLPGDCAVQAISQVSEIDFGKIKPFFDLAFVLIGVSFSLRYLGHLEGVREGTVFAAFAGGLIFQLYDKLFCYKIDEYLNH